MAMGGSDMGKLVISQKSPSLRIRIAGMEVLNLPIWMLLCYETMNGRAPALPKDGVELQCELELPGRGQVIAFVDRMPEDSDDD